MPYKNKEDKRAQARRWKAANGAHHRANLNEWRRARNQTNRNRMVLLKQRPCMDCGGTFPSVCMDFDHVRGEKKFILAHGVSQWPWSVIKREIDKCDVVCSNCHRIRTAKRKAEKRANLPREKPDLRDDLFADVESTGGGAPSGPTAGVPA